MKFLCFSLVLTLVSACKDCKDNPRVYRTDFWPLDLASDNYDKKTNTLKRDKLVFGVFTNYNIPDDSYCTGIPYGRDLLAGIEFSLSEYIVLNKDTLPARVNLFSDTRFSSIIKMDKNEASNYDAMYVIYLNNDSVNLSGYYTFYIKAVTDRGHSFEDSTIAFIY